jgi:hypothetical protein
MARVLIVGCGCRGQGLARELLRKGHAVRGTTREAGHRAAIEATGAESAIADPDRIGTLLPALDGVTILCLLLGSAIGSPVHIEALHTTRLDMLLQRAIDTTIRGITYEARGSIPQEILTTGAELVKAKCTHNGIPHRILTPPPDVWLNTSIGAVEALLATG